MIIIIIIIIIIITYYHAIVIVTIVYFYCAIDIFGPQRNTFVAGKHFVAVEVKLIIAMLVSRYAIHVDSDEPGRSPDPFDRTSFAGVRVKLTNHNGVKEPAMYESLRKCHRGNKKFLLFR
jgi:hypothetical protein